MIKELLNYQTKERERLALVSGVENGKAKRELDDATVSLDNGKKVLLGLENDAKVLMTNYQSVSKNLKEIFDKIEMYQKSVKPDMDEEESTNSMTFVSGLLSKVSAYESQLNDIANKINAKNQAFEDIKVQVVKAQSVIKNAGEQYQKQTAGNEGELKKIDEELKKLEAAVDKKLMEKFKLIRKNVRKGDIVVELKHNRCGGCMFELPLATIHKISNDGYIVCEECEKIIYKNG